MRLRLMLAAFAASLLLCPAANAQKISDLPAATTLTGTEKIPGIQGSGCATHVAPCTNVALTSAQIATLVSNSLDAQLVALAALTPSANTCIYWTGTTAATTYSCSSFVRGLEAASDAAGFRSSIGLTIGTNVQAWDADLDAIAALSGTNTLYYRSASNTWSPVTIGSNLTFSGGTLAATAGGSGTVTSVSVTTANGVSGSVATATSTPAITLTLGAITPSSVTASGTVTGSNLSGTNTGDQTTISGNAGTATKWQTARTLSFTGDATGSGSVDGSANVATSLTLATSGVTASTYGGSSGSPSITFDAKGRATAASTATLGVSGGGTGDTGTAWSTFTPTMTAHSGTLTTASASGRYKTIGKTAFISIKGTVTTNGSGAAWITFTLPFTSAAVDQILPANGGAVPYGGYCQINASSTTANCFRYDGGYLGGDGNVVLMTGVIEIS